MNPFLIIVIGIATLFVLFQFWSFFKSKKSIGKGIPYENITPEISELVRDKKGLLYFHSPSCSNCVVQSPIIEKIKSKYDSIISIDASKNLQTARAFNVMGTPSIITFSGNKIDGFFVGVKKEEFLIKKLQSL